MARAQRVRPLAGPMINSAAKQIHTPSFRGDAKHRTRNLEIPRCAIAHLRSGADAPSRNDGGWDYAMTDRTFGRHRVTSVQVSGTEGYADEAEDLFKRYEGIPAADAHRAVRHLIPTAPGRVLDIGSGTGRDAAWFASMGHRVVAVEPTDALRLPAMVLHPSPQIEWLNDSLPELALVRRQIGR